jgi:type I restriction enzyme S subunit
MSWRKVKLEELLTESRIPCDNPNPDRRIKVKLKVLGVKKRGLESEIEGATKQFTRKAGQFIYGKQNFHKGAFGIIPNELDGYESSADLPAFDVAENCLPEWIFYFFKQGNFYLELTKIARGVATQRIHPEQIYEIEIPLPDLKTQKQLLAKIKSLENNGDDLKNELTHQLTLVKKLRQQLLQDAVQGKLVEQNPNDEPASELLKKIKAEKEKLIAEKKLKKEKELPPIKPEEIPFGIPENWSWCYLGDLCQLINGDRSKNYPNKHEYVPEGYPWINTGHIESDGTLTKSNMYFITKEKFDSLRSGKIQADDLVYCLRGATFGKTAFVTPYNIGAIASSLMIIRLSDLLIKKFIFYYLKSDFAMKQLYRFNNGSAQPNLAANDVNRYLFPLPPLPEQVRIVQKVEELMQYCNDLEASIKQSESQNEKLLQQVLREALRREEVEV